MNRLDEQKDLIPDASPEGESKRQRKRTGDVDIVNGKLLPSLIRYIVPLAIAAVLQVLYNAADIIVVGNFAGQLAYSSVGATGPINSLLIASVVGVSVGANIIIARYLGARDARKTERAVHTSFLFSLLLGVSMLGIGELLSVPLLRLTGCPEEVMAGASLYMRIYYIGIPATFVYNFMAAVLRTKGDSKRPLIYLTVSGIVNVVLNIVLVAGFHLGVAGVAVATVVSQYISAVCVVVRLLHLPQDDFCRLSFSKMRIDGAELLRIIRFGVPSMISSSLYSISNMQIQSAINSFGPDGISGNSSATSIESFMTAVTGTLSAAAAAFVGQNIGAGRRERVPRIYRCIILIGVVPMILIGIPLLIFGEEVLSLYLPNAPGAVEFGLVRMRIMIPIISMNVVMNANSGTMQAFGYTLQSMIVSLLAVCGFRTAWMLLVYPHFETPFMLYICYTCSWSLTMLIGLGFVISILARYKRGKNFAL